MKKKALTPKKLALSKMNISVLSPDSSFKLKGGEQTLTIVCTPTTASFIDDCLTLKPPTYTGTV
ncbi:hypothetical protein [Pedobacter steynii]|uniref:hypothetical protein n=1 Tax=Pedobacter steynii TaxID=430522 RepID=UPI0012F9BAA5|nr:hypothetical protein [Pedobacter steynii]